jgi:hypothetical protein
LTFNAISVGLLKHCDSYEAFCVGARRAKQGNRLALLILNVASVNWLPNQVKAKHERKLNKDRERFHGATSFAKSKPVTDAIAV